MKSNLAICASSFNYENKRILSVHFRRRVHCESVFDKHLWHAEGATVTGNKHSRFVVPPACLPQKYSLSASIIKYVIFLPKSLYLSYWHSFVQISSENQGNKSKGDSPSTAKGTCHWLRKPPLVTGKDIKSFTTFGNGELVLNFEFKYALLSDWK